MISSLFNTILYQPLFNALILLYEYIPGHDFGIAVIVLTTLIRFALYPLMAQSIKSQKVLNELQPKIQEIQKQHASDKEKQGKAMMELYKQEKFNPFGGCLPLLVQFPILIALYQVFWRGFKPEQLNFLYDFVQNPGVINSTFLGLINLDKPNIIFAFLAGILQFFQSKMIMPVQQQQQKGQMSQFSGIMQKQMLYFMPLFTVFILWKLPAAIGLYWIVTTIFSIIQQKIIYSPSKNIQKIK
jgi:YidC/Oxa1 family membrane protein insertase